jgi:hypothetical protein
MGTMAAAMILALCVIRPSRHEPVSTRLVPQVDMLPATPPGESPVKQTDAMAAAKPEPPSLAIATTPPGIPIQNFPAVVEKPSSSEAVEAGESPAKVDGLQPGAYRLILGGDRWTSSSLPEQIEEGERNTPVRDVPHGIARFVSQPPGAEVYEGEVLLGTTPVSIPVPPGRHVFVATLDGNKTVSRTVDMAADQTKDVEFGGKAISDSRGGREVAHHRRRPKRHAPEPMLAKIGRSIKEGLQKAEAVMFPRPGKDRRVWD